ncbi:hypothetical protein R5R35_005659 [Gryllus longicercus]|uniref:Uncharacterized protein n=1 Tax=Gryllus longicercus TaxID=2509291 RepID=A0AAN9VP73_9ORTH
MASKQEDDAIALVGLSVTMKCKKKRIRKAWCIYWLTKRNEYTHTILLNELSSVPTDYRNYLRMNEEVFQKLLSLVTTLIQKKNTVIRTISPHKKLTATLKFLAMGQYECPKYSTINPMLLKNNSGNIYSVLKNCES